MKNKLFKLTLFIAALFIFGCTSSDDGFPSESSSENEMSTPDLEKFYDMIVLGNTKLNDDTLFKGENNGNGVEIVAFYSNDGFWTASFPIMDKGGILTHWCVIVFPQNGEDRALVFSETEMMVNFNSHDARMFIITSDWEQVVYSNWGEEDVSGLYKGRGKTGYVHPEWAPNAYYWGPFAPVIGDDNYIFHIKSTLYPTNGGGNPWNYSSESETVEFSYTLNGQNGKMKQTSTIR